MISISLLDHIKIRFHKSSYCHMWGGRYFKGRYVQGISDLSNHRLRTKFSFYRQRVEKVANALQKDIPVLPNCQQTESREPDNAHRSFKSICKR